MTSFFFIESRDPFTDQRVLTQFELIAQIANAGHSVTLMFVQNGVTSSLKSAIVKHYNLLNHNNISLLADAFSLQQRGITTDELRTEISVTDMSPPIKALLDGQKVIWF